MRKQFFNSIFPNIKKKSKTRHKTSRLCNEKMKGQVGDATKITQMHTMSICQENTLIPCPKGSQIDPDIKS
jgi:hypothetical protein